jgi:hypothetical protein
MTLLAVSPFGSSASGTAPEMFECRREPKTAVKKSTLGGCK